MGDQSRRDAVQAIRFDGQPLSTKFRANVTTGLDVLEQEKCLWDFAFLCWANPNVLRIAANEQVF
jgi:hypothetical protein